MLTYSFVRSKQDITVHAYRGEICVGSLTCHSSDGWQAEENQHWRGSGEVNTEMHSLIEAEIEGPSVFKPDTRPLKTAARRRVKHQTLAKHQVNGHAKGAKVKSHGYIHKPAPKKSSTTPDAVGEYMRQHGPYLYHAILPEGLPDGKTELDVIQSIKKNGLLPPSMTDAGQDVAEPLRSRNNHVYAANHMFAQQMTGDQRHPQIAIDLRRINPEMIDSDEDHVIHALETNTPLTDAQHVHPVSWDTHEADLTKGGFRNLGDWADHHSSIIDTPEWVDQSMKYGSMAIRGGVPPEAIRVNPAWVANNKPAPVPARRSLWDRAQGWLKDRQ